MRATASLIRFMEDITLYLNVVELQYLTSVDNQVTQAGFSSQKFTDDDTDKRKADADLHNTDDDRKVAGKNYFGQDIFFAAA